MSSRPRRGASSASVCAAASGSCVDITTIAPRSASARSAAIIRSPVGGVEVAGRLVGEQYVGLGGERPGQRDPLLLAAGQLLDQVVAGLLEPDQSQRPRRYGGQRPRARPRRRAAAPATFSRGGQRGGEAVALRHHGDARAAAACSRPVIGGVAEVRPCRRRAQARRPAPRAGTSSRRRTGRSPTPADPAATARSTSVQGDDLAVRRTRSPSARSVLASPPGPGAAASGAAPSRRAACRRRPRPGGTAPGCPGGRSSRTWSGSGRNPSAVTTAYSSPLRPSPPIRPSRIVIVRGSAAATSGSWVTRTTVVPSVAVDAGRSCRAPGRGRRGRAGWSARRRAAAPGRGGHRDRDARRAGGARASEPRSGRSASAAEADGLQHVGAASGRSLPARAGGTLGEARRSRAA